MRFLGGSDEVGSLSFTMETPSGRVLFDHGYTPSSTPSFPLDPPTVSHVFLSHAHIDHSGLVPSVCSGHNASLVCTEPTHSVASVLLRDSLKVSKYEGFRLPYDKRDIKETMNNAKVLKYGDSMRTNGLEVTPLPSGHIPGSAMYQVISDSEEKILFTGDMNTNSTRLIDGCKPVHCNTLVMESTYAGEEHDSRAKVEYNFLEKIDEVVSRGGRAVVPSFAVGRTQEILLLLEQTNYNIWLDGMGFLITRLMLEHPRYLKDAGKLRRALRRINHVSNPAARDRAVKGDVIVTTSGMLDGGPVHFYLDRLKDNSRNAILLTGYQVEGTNGRKLLETGSMTIHEKETAIKCEVEKFDFSAHAGHTDLLNFVRECDPETVILVHGENRHLLAEEIEDEREVILPEKGKAYGELI